MIPVKNSSNVEAIGFQPHAGDKGTLTVKFKGGKDYTFKSVPLSVWEDFRDAESKGSYFAKHIKGKFGG